MTGPGSRIKSIDAWMTVAGSDDLLGAITYTKPWGKRGLYLNIAQLNLKQYHTLVSKLILADRCGNGHLRPMQAGKRWIGWVWERS